MQSLASKRGQPAAASGRWQQQGNGVGACSSRPASAKRSPTVKVQAVFVRAPPMRGDDFFPDEQGSKGAASKAAQFASAAYKANGKTAVIVGGSQGIGRATALEFAKHGYNVVVAARNAEKLAQVAEDCADVAGRKTAAMAIPTDITNADSVYDLVNHVMAKYSTLDALVINAGVFAKGLFLDTPVEEARRLMEVNCLGPYSVAQAFLPVLINTAQRRNHFDKPSLIMVNGFAGKVPCKFMSAYSASKAAQAALTAVIREEVASARVHVGLVHPGMVKSNQMERSEFYGQQSEVDRRAWNQALRMLPLTQSSKEVAGAIYHMAVSKQNEVVVGAPFAVAASMHKALGFNPSAVPFMS